MRGFSLILLSLADDGDLTVDDPEDVLTPKLIEELRAQKSDLLVYLRADPVTPMTKWKMYGELMERVNAEYKGWPIDWEGLKEYEELILKAVIEQLPSTGATGGSA